MAATIAFGVLATVGAVTVLAAVALYGVGLREAAIARRVDAHMTQRPYDWECETACPDCNPPLDQRDVELWCRQVIAADQDQIMREATR